MNRMGKQLGQNASGLKSYAKSVGARFALRTLRALSGATQVVAMQRSDVRKEGPLVFDLTVERHNSYLANGLLVSNSDAFQILAVGMKRAMGVIDNIPGGQEDDTLIGLALDDERPVVAPYEMDEGI